jgi:outer membrane protein TolC
MDFLLITTQLKTKVQKMKSKTFLTSLLLLITSAVFAQDTLSVDEFLAIVKRYHPLAESYRLQNEIADAQVLKARGNFDPILAGKNGAKTIDGVDYYRESNLNLEIPTWYGVDFTGSYNHVEGQRLNSSETSGGLYQLGLTVPLAKNLLYDKRRATLDQARSAKNMTLAEQIFLTNALLLEAENTFWEWAKSYQILQLQIRTTEVNRLRLEYTKKTLQYGERAAIDTTEARSQLQSFELQQEEAKLQFIKNTQHLQLYLWRENQEIYSLTQLIIPAHDLDYSSAFESFPSLINEIKSNNIDENVWLKYYFQKQEILESERKLKRQSFLPKLDFTYNFLNKQNYSTAFFPLFNNNYQYGLKLEIPLFLRQARADYRIAEIKLRQNDFDTDLKRREILTKAETYLNEVVNYRNQINLTEQNIINYRQLLNAEETRFSNGESSLFLINSRENKLIETQQKAIELRLKFLKSYNQLKWLNENFVND